MFSELEGGKATRRRYIRNETRIRGWTEGEVGPVKIGNGRRRSGLEYLTKEISEMGGHGNVPRGENDRLGPNAKMDD